MIFLLPPSEGKTIGGTYQDEKCSYFSEKPLDIAINATSSDLKCSGKRYEEGISLNKVIHQGPFSQAIQRYSGVMYKAIDYGSLTQQQKELFDNSVYILSGMHGLLHPTDRIANYKLPIGTKGLISFWGDSITQKLNTFPKAQVVDLLSGSYKKMINRKQLDHKVVHVDFYQNGKKLTHAVKGVKGRWLSTQIRQGVTALEVGEHIYEDIKGTITIFIK